MRRNYYKKRRVINEFIFRVLSKNSKNRIELIYKVLGRMYSKNTKTKFQDYILKEIIKGESKEKICSRLRKRYPRYRLDYAAMHENVRLKIQANSSLHGEKIVREHIELCDRIYKKFDSLNHEEGKAQVLAQKEALLNMMESANHIDIDQLDTSRLSEKERTELFSYLKRL